MTEVDCLPRDSRFLFQSSSRHGLVEAPAAFIHEFIEFLHHCMEAGAFAVILPSSDGSMDHRPQFLTTILGIRKMRFMLTILPRDTSRCLAHRAPKRRARCHAWVRCRGACNHFEILFLFAVWDVRPHLTSCFPSGIPFLHKDIPILECLILLST